MLACLAATAQSPADLFSKAPPEIEEALRGRIAKFYEAHRDGKFRLADQLVAEDSKDIFFESDKRRCKKFEISKIGYLSEDFQSANVLILCDTSLLMPPAGIVEVKMPIPSKWKVIDGQWFWYVEAQAARQSPFGKMLPGEGSEGGLPTSIPRGPDAAALLKMVTVDKTALPFTAGQAGSLEILISSELPGEAHLSIDAPKSSDLSYEIEKPALASKQSTRLTVRYKPDGRQPRRSSSQSEFRILVQPLNKVIPVQVTFR